MPHTAGHLPNGYEKLMLFQDGRQELVVADPQALKPMGQARCHYLGDLDAADRLDTVRRVRVLSGPAGGWGGLDQM